MVGEEVPAQHAFEPHGRVSAARTGLGVDRLDRGTQRGPRHDAVHLVEEHRAARGLVRGLVIALESFDVKAALFHARPLLGSILSDPRNLRAGCSELP